MKTKSIATTAWASIKNKVYNVNPNTNKNFVINKDDIEIEYTNENNNIYRKINHRLAPNQEKELITFPETEFDHKAFNYFTKSDLKNNVHNFHLREIQSASFLKNSLFNIPKYYFSTAYYNSKKIASEQNGLKPDFEIDTSVGTKNIKGFSYHKNKDELEGKLQINSFQDGEEYLTRVQSEKIGNINSPVIRLGSTAKFNHKDFEIQMDLFCIKQPTYDDIIVMAKLNKKNQQTEEEANSIKVASKFTGHAMLDKDNKMIIGKDGIPKTKYNADKGEFVSMEGINGNTVVLQLIAEKTQKITPNDSTKLYFIPVSHPSIDSIFNVSEALSHIKNTLTKEPELIDFIFGKYGLSTKEVAVSLIEAIEIDNNEKGVFNVELDALYKTHPQLVEYLQKLIKESSDLDENNTYSIEIDNQKDEFDEVIVHFNDIDYIEKNEQELIGNNDFNSDSENV